MKKKKEEKRKDNEEDEVKLLSLSLSPNLSVCFFLSPPVLPFHSNSPFSLL